MICTMGKPTNSMDNWKKGKDLRKNTIHERMYMRNQYEYITYTK